MKQKLAIFASPCTSVRKRPVIQSLVDERGSQTQARIRNGFELVEAYRDAEVGANRPQTVGGSPKGLRMKGCEPGEASVNLRIACVAASKAEKPA